MATTGDAVSVEEVTALGVESKKAKQSVSNKKLAAALRHFITLAKEAAGSDVTTETHGDKAKQVFEFAQKVKGTNEANHRMLFTFLFRDAPSGISTTEQINAAVKFVNAAGADAVTEEAFSAASGVGVVVTEEEVKATVTEVVTASAAALEDNGWGYQFKVIEQVKNRHPFASGATIRAECMAQLTALLGENVDNGKGLKKGKQKAAKKDRAAEKKIEQQKAAEEAAAKAEAAARESATAQATAAEGAGGEDAAKEDVVTPWDVEGGHNGVDYNKLIDTWGCQPITDAQLQRMRDLGLPVHRFLRRGIFFSHRDLDIILDLKEKGEPFYLYTGRGPSSDSMHLGHLVPFLFTKHLQDIFQVPLVIQMTDDEKFLFKENLTLDDDPQTGVTHMLRQNAKDIIALGFNRETTFMFSDLDYMGGAFFKNIVRVQQKVSLHTCKKIFDFKDSDNIGKIAYPATQVVPSFSSSFPHMLPPRATCLIPCAIDQDPYFRLTRQIATSLGEQKPALLHSKFFPAMGGVSKKMSSSTQGTSTIFLTDKPEEIAQKVQGAFSGAPKTLAEHKEKGADTSVDVAYQYLTFFLEDDEELARIEKEYSAGRMMTGDVKKILIDILKDLVAGHQAARAKVTEEEVDYFMSVAKFSAKAQ